MSRHTRLAIVVPMLLSTAAPAWCGAPALVRLRGSDFVGGAAELFGAAKFGVSRVNYIYAAPTGPRATMTASFGAPAWPDEPVLLWVRARLDDRNTPCPVRIALNGVTVFEGPNALAHDRWERRSFALPAEALQPGRNEVTFANTSSEGVVGMPPWFMLADCALATADYDPAAPPPIEDDFHVTLPGEVRPLPEPLPPGRTEPGFRFRGMKGWLWLPHQYLAEIPVLAAYRMNFLMNCYGSMHDIEHYPWGSPQCNRWWEPLPEGKKQAYAEVVRSCQQHGLNFCFSLNPNLFATRTVRYDSAEDLEALWQHYTWMQSLGVQWFNVQFDDISQGIDPAGQARLTNALLQRLREHDLEAQMVICPTFYWGTGEEAAAWAYLEVLARELDPDVYVIWTGDAVVTKRITQPAAASYRRVVGHRLFIWDNYPVNDGNPTLHLGPVTGRDVGLCEVADGYMSNPMSPQNEINRLPLLTIADYAYNPWSYDPARSIGQAIMHLGETPEQRRVLKDLVELYPGDLIFGQGTNWNPLVSRFTEITSEPHSRYLADLYLRHVANVAGRLRRNFPDRFADAEKTVRGNLEQLHGIYRERYGE